MKKMTEYPNVDTRRLAIALSVSLTFIAICTWVL